MARSAVVLLTCLLASVLDMTVGAVSCLCMCQIAIIQNAMKDIHYSVSLSKYAKPQALDVRDYCASTVSVCVYAYRSEEVVSGCVTPSPPGPVCDVRSSESCVV